MKPSLSPHARRVRKPPSDPSQSDTGTGNQDYVEYTVYFMSNVRPSIDENNCLRENISVRSLVLHLPERRGAALDIATRRQYQDTVNGGRRRLSGTAWPSAGYVR